MTEEQKELLEDLMLEQREGMGYDIRDKRETNEKTIA